MDHTQKKSRRRGRSKLSATDIRARDQRRKVDGERLNAALHQFRLSQSEAARRSTIPQGHINAIVNGNRDLGREELRKLSAIGISSDNLLGCNVPVELEERTPIGTLANALRAELQLRAPSGAPSIESLDADVLLGRMAAAWWSSALRHAGTSTCHRLERLADRLDQDAAGRFRRLAPLLTLRARQFREHADVVRSPAARWEHLDGFGEPYALVADNVMTGALHKIGFRSDGAMLCTPFNVWGGSAGAGVAWRSGGQDAIWYVDATTGEVVHDHGPNLLVSMLATNARGKAFATTLGIKY